MKASCLTLTLAVIAAGTMVSLALDGPTPVRTLGPTGLEIDLQKNLSLKVTKVQAGSPADGKFAEGQIITTINGKTIPDGFVEHRKFLADQITHAEAKDGTITFTTDKGDVSIRIPTLGSFSKTWPVNCPKTEKIIAANAAYLRTKAGEGKLESHGLTDGLGILALLSTGEQADLDAVRGIYQRRMAKFDNQIGPQSWHNGMQGIAACEYYLRTGDTSVMPLIQAICEAARRYQVHGSYYHWATAANPKYGVVNATGTNMLTFMLLAKTCGAKVDEKTLNESLTFFYRFAGHGSNAYGDGRPESGLGSNGKTQQIAMAMQIASKATNGNAYAAARDHCASVALYDYSAMLGGHTGPIGMLYYNPVSSLVMDQFPDLYRNRQEETRWFYELSRQHDGSFVMSSCRGYDNEEYGHAVLLGLTAPKHHLQILGAPNSKFGKAFQLPELPWGRPADQAFLRTKGSADYKPLDPSPHAEYEKIKTATKEQLRSMAGHPQHAFRQAISAAIRDGGHFDLIESLLGSKDPFERHTGCMAINQFEPWQLRNSKGWLSGLSIDPVQFTPKMFESLIAMVRNPDESLWLVDQALLALAAAKPEQIMANLDAITPWLNHEEWWFYESATIALSPALNDLKSAKQILPLIAKAHGKMDHMRARTTVEYLMRKNADSMPEEIRQLAGATLRDAYVTTPNQTWEEGSMDLSAIPSVALANTIEAALTMDPQLAPELAKLSVTRLKDLQTRERVMHIDALVAAAQKLDDAKRKVVGDILAEHYRSAIYEENAEAFEAGLKGSIDKLATPLNKVLEIDALRGLPGGWLLLDNNRKDGQDWLITSIEPEKKPDDDQRERYRQIPLPESLNNWFATDYPVTGWQSYSAKLGPRAPTNYRNQPAWKSLPPGQAGEVLFLRKTFEVEDPDQALLRLLAFSRQGYRIYLNGVLITESKGRSKTWSPRITYSAPDGKIHKALKKGTNVLAATSFMQYFKGTEGDIEVYLEGLKELPKR